MPESWPALPDLTMCSTYAEVAAAVMQPFVGDDIDANTLSEFCRQAYDTFSHPAVVPLVQVDYEQWIAELFHGPTLAFKDLALQIVGRLFDHVLGRRGEWLTIIGATSGDTGSAAIEAVRGHDNIGIVMLFPHGRVSDVQRRQMTTVADSNVHVVAVDGTFDDCQDLVKAMFADQQFRERMRLSAVNSINWARIMAQVVYYVTTARALARPPVFSVPTGNFGNVLSGWVAKQMGVTIAGLTIATNTNDILARFFVDNDMSVRQVVPTLSPSMDIQISSNFERLLFEMNGRDGGMTAEQLTRMRATGRLAVEPDQRAAFLHGVFRAASVDDDATLAEIRRLHDTTGVLVDPHTATASVAARLGLFEGPTVTLATAHPAKFPDAVAQAIGVRPPVPPALASFDDSAERMDRAPNDLAAVMAVVERAAR